MIDLSTNYLGFNLKNPIIAGSSGLTNSIENLLEIEKAGASAVILKSLFEEEIRLELDKDMLRMQREAFIYPEIIDFYDNLLSKDDTLTNYIKLVTDAKKKLKIPVIASINCVTSGKWPAFAQNLEDAGTDGIELNIFILPSNLHRTRNINEKLHFEIIEEVLEYTKIPVSVKISYFSSNLAVFIKNLSQTGIKGLVLFNRFYSPDIDIENLEVTSSNIYSNANDFTIPLRWIAMMSNEVSCDLAASTGIHDGSAVIKQLLAGADAVQVVSTLYKNGTSYIKTIIDELTKWMENKGYNSIQDFKGKMSREKAKNPAAFERVQFMKYFSGK